MNFKYITLFPLVLIILGCATVTEVNRYDVQANKLRVDAYNLYNKGWNGLAISKVKESIEVSWRNNTITINLIEGYDDAGLYYYQIGDYENSVRFQSIAFLLSNSFDKNNKINATYLKRLGWAYNKFKPDFDISKVTDNPESLLCLNHVELHKNQDIQKVFYHMYPHPKKYSKKMVLNGKSCDT